MENSKKYYSIGAKAFRENKRCSAMSDSNFVDECEKISAAGISLN